MVGVLFRKNAPKRKSSAFGTLADISGAGGCRKKILGKAFHGWIVHSMRDEQPTRVAPL
jgi:hypothetical protein